MKGNTSNFMREWGWLVLLMISVVALVFFSFLSEVENNSVSSATDEDDQKQARMDAVAYCNDLVVNGSVSDVLGQRLNSIDDRNEGVVTRLNGLPRYRRHGTELPVNGTRYLWNVWCDVPIQACRMVCDPKTELCFCPSYVYDAYFDSEDVEAWRVQHG